MGTTLSTMAVHYCGLDALSFDKLVTRLRCAQRFTSSDPSPLSTAGLIEFGSLGKEDT
jgi:hypothetical protein